MAFLNRNAHKALKYVLSKILCGLDVLVKAISFEWLMTETDQPNGGTLIAVRACLIALLMYLVYIAVSHGCDPTRTNVFCWTEFKEEFGKSFQYFSALLGGTYLALYARFSSQWSYLAQLYNSIKSIEVQAAIASPVIAEWKAGFIEDAFNLHLATKNNFAPIISAGCRDEKVREAFCKYTPNGHNQLDCILKSVEKVIDLESKRGHEC